MSGFANFGVHFNILPNGLISHFMKGETEAAHGHYPKLHNEKSILRALDMHGNVYVV